MHITVFLAHTVDQPAIRHTRGDKNGFAGSHLVQIILAIKVRNAGTRCALTLIIIAEDESATAFAPQYNSKQQQPSTPSGAPP